MIQQIDVVCAVALEGNRALVMRRKGELTRGGEWEFPGGKVRAGESFRVALGRELREELDLQPPIGEILAVGFTPNPDSLIRVIGFRVELGEPVGKSKDHDESRWIKKSDLESIHMSPADLEIALRVFPQEMEIHSVGMAGTFKLFVGAYFLIGCVTAALMLAMGKTPALSDPSNLMKIGTILSIPIGYAFVGGLFSLLAVSTYNFFAKWIGGIKIELSR